MWDPKRLYVDRTPELPKEAPRPITERPVVTVTEVIVENAIEQGVRWKNLRAIGFDNYRDYIKSPLWRDIRSRIKIRSGKKCEICICGRPSKVVHHLDYTIEILLGNNLGGLVDVCHECHAMMHSKRKKRGKNRKPSRSLLKKRNRRLRKQLAKHMKAFHVKP